MNNFIELKVQSKKSKALSAFDFQLSTQATGRSA